MVKFDEFDEHEYELQQEFQDELFTEGEGNENGDTFEIRRDESGKVIGASLDASKMNKTDEDKFVKEFTKMNVENENGNDKASIILLKAGDTSAKKIKVGTNENLAREEWFPSKLVPYCLDRFECYSTQNLTGSEDYYVVFTDGHNKGPFNKIATWLCKLLPDGVNPTGNFVIARKRQVVIDTKEDSYWEEINGEVELDLKQLKKLFSKSF